MSSRPDNIPAAGKTKPFMNTTAGTSYGSQTATAPVASGAELLMAKARNFARAGSLREAFQCGAEALLMRPGDVGILSFIAELNYKPATPPRTAAVSAPATSSPGTPIQNGAPGVHNRPSTFDSLPFVQRVRKLRQITGGSTGCGWMNDEMALLVYSLVKWFKPELVVQTGHLWGKSALMVLESLNDGFLTAAAPLETEPQQADRYFTKFRESNRPPEASKPKFISVDPAPSEVPHSDAGIKFLKDLHAEFEFHQMMSTDFFNAHGPRLAAEYAHQRILGIVDGDHTYWGCLLDLEGFARLGARMIIVDDTMWLPYIGRAARAFARRHHYQVLDLTWYNGVAILFKQGDTMPTIHSRPSGFSPRVALAHALYCLGGLSLMRLVRRPRD
jgi:cephalosporin hydroxylase